MHETDAVVRIAVSVLGVLADEKGFWIRRPLREEILATDALSGSHGSPSRFGRGSKSFRNGQFDSADCVHFCIAARVESLMAAEPIYED